MFVHDIPWKEVLSTLGLTLVVIVFAGIAIYKIVWETRKPNQPTAPPTPLPIEESWLDYTGLDR